MSAAFSRACAHQPATRPTAKIGLYRRADVDALRRLQRSAGAPEAAAREIPLAETWIRE